MRTLCPYCGVGCGLSVRTERGRLRAVEGDPLYPVNRGRTCRKPLELASAVHAPDRVLTPLVRARRDVGFRPASWDDAMPALAARLRAIVDEHGPNAVAFYISGQLLTEDYYAVNKLAKGFLGTNNVDSNSRLCMSSAVAGYRGAFGYDGPPAAYADLALADCLLLVGSNAAACHPIVWSRIRDRQAEGAFVICADPRATPTARESDLHLPLRPGTDLALLNAMLHVVEAEGWVDEAFVGRSTTGFDAAIAVARDWTPARAASVCGVPADAIVHAARRFAGAGRAMALWSMGANQSSEGTAKNRALINLCLATGQIAREGAGPLSLTGQPNAMGGRETGGLAHLLPGYRSVESADDRAAMEAHWGIPAGAISASPGLPAVELFDALADGRVRAVWVMATNPAVSLPDSAKAREALARAELVVVQDAHHPTETTALADAVLPAAAWPEKTGTMTNSERRVGLVRRALPPPGEALPDWRIVAMLAGALGFGDAFAWADEAEVFAEFATCTRGRPCDVSSVSHERLRREGSVQWGGERLYSGGTFPKGRARFAATPFVGPAERPDDRFPLTLTTGRVASHWHTLSRTGKSAALREADGEPFVELHPDDATVPDGEVARIVSRRGAVTARVRLDASLPPGTAFAPFHWGELHAPPGAGQVNAVTLPALDPTSHQPELKAAAVRIEPVRHRARPRRRRIVVVGTGRAGLECVEEVLRRSDRCTITMLGEEPGPAYDRIQLSRVLARTAGPGAADLRSAAWYAQAGVDLRGGSPAVALDPDRRVVRDASGEEHRYDALVLATGSRPFVPPIPGADLQQLHTFRTLRDVALIEDACRRARSAVVIGGGLLGLEAAAGVRARGVPVTVIEAADRLMPAQLDHGGARMLARALERLGIPTHVDARVASVRELQADLVIVAAGVRPEVSLAREAGLEVDRGIVVDDLMRTSAPGVLAAGECAQHRGTVYGLWAPLAEQARVAAAGACDQVAGFAGAVAATTLKVAGVDVFAGGTAAGEDELVWSDSRRGVYRKLVLEDDRLAGAILVGDTAQGRALSALLRDGAPVPEQLLAPPGAARVEQPPLRDGDLVCSCNGVRAAELRRAIRAGGLTTVAAVGRATRATTGCGSCTRDVERILAVHQAETHE